MSTGSAGPDVRLTCRPGIAGKQLTFQYQVENHGPGAAYLMDALPAADHASGNARANDQIAVVILRDQAEAVIGKYVPPLPTDRRIIVPLQPLVCLLKPGEALERELRVSLPLAETSPYLPDLLLREYEIVELQAVLFAIGFWPRETPNLHATPSGYDPDHLTIINSGPPAVASLASQRFPIRSLQLFKRTDAFPRAI